MPTFLSRAMYGDDGSVYPRHSNRGRQLSYESDEEMYTDDDGEMSDPDAERFVFDDGRSEQYSEGVRDDYDTDNGDDLYY